jgi:hypothetical protein
MIWYTHLTLPFTATVTEEQRGLMVHDYSTWFANRQDDFTCFFFAVRQRGWYALFVCDIR